MFICWHRLFLQSEHEWLFPDQECSRLRVFLPGFSHALASSADQDGLEMKLLGQIPPPLSRTSRITPLIVWLNRRSTFLARACLTVLCMASKKHIDIE